MSAALQRISEGRTTLGPFTPPDPIEVGLAGVLVTAFAVQMVAQLFFNAGHAVQRLALSSASLAEGRPWTILTHIFLHGGITHIFLNASFATAVTPPVMRALGRSAGGLARFMLFFLVCGVAGGLTFVLFHLHSQRAAIGASGALSGLCGAAIRANLGRGALAHPFSRDVLRASAPFLLLNVVLMGLLAGAGVPIAWEAHLGGFLTGLLLFGLFVPRRSGAVEVEGPWSST